MKNGYRMLGKLAAVIALAVVLMAGSAVAAALAAVPAGPASLVHPGAASLGVVTIFANGSLSNPLAPVSVSGSTYTLTGDLNGELRDLASRVTLDGAGYDVNYTVNMTGGSNASVDVANASQVVVENFRASNATNGIYLFNVSGGTVSANALAKLVNAITIANSSTIQVTDNGLNFTHGYGVYAVGSSGLTVSNNWFLGNGTKSLGYGIETDYVSSVTIENDQFNGSHFAVDVFNGHDVAISGNNASNTGDGFGVDSVQNGSITDNVAFNSSYGAWSEASINVTVANNREVDDYDPLYDYEDSGFTAANNYAPFNGQPAGEGIYSYESTGSVFDGNDLANSGNDAVYLYYPAGVRLADNDLTNATNYGVYEEYGYGPVWLVNDQFAEPASGSHVPEGVYSDASYGPLYLANSSLDNLSVGVYLDDAHGPTTAVNDSMTNELDYAVYSDYSYGAITISGSDLSGSSEGVDVEDSYAGGLTVTGDRINGTSDGVFDADYGYGTTSLTVTGNTITNDTDGVYAYELQGPTSIVGNDLEHASEYGIYSYYSDYQPTTIADNDVSNSGYEGITVYTGLSVSVVANVASNDTYAGLDIEEGSGQTTIAGNQVQHSPGYGIYAYDAYGPLSVTGNNASHSYEGLILDLNAYISTVVGNDVSNSTYVDLGDNDLGQVSGNDFLGDGSLQFVSNHLGLFFHNDVNSSAFVASGNLLEGSWNAAYPIGGNYWTGYAGTDAYSGPAQNVPGSDGIGDAPYTLDGQTDQYPLMQPWTNPVATFFGSGLPPSSTWSVTLNGAVQSTVSNGAVVFAEMNGAHSGYTYTVRAPAGYVAAPASGVGTFVGRDISIDVHFSIAGYSVVVNESGLSTGTAWGIELGGVWTNGSASSLTATEPNGTFVYHLAAVNGFTATPSEGSVVVAGHTVYLPIVYAPTSLSVTFVESGLPAGDGWSVTFNGANPVSSTSTTIVVVSHAGTWSFALTAPTGYSFSPSSSSVTLQNSNVTIYVVATTTTAATSSGSGGSTVASNLFDGVVVGLVLALVLAAVGWVLYARRRPAPPPSGPPTPPAAGVKAWDESASPGGAPSSPPGTPPTPPPGAH